MTLKSNWISLLFLVAALYDGLIGALFFLAPYRIFRIFHALPPIHPGYVQFPALVIIIFGAIFYKIATDPAKYREFIKYGVGLKVAFAGLTLGYHLHGGVPFMWLPLAGADIAFLVMFLMAWRALGAEYQSAEGRSQASPPRGVAPAS